MIIARVIDARNGEIHHAGPDDSVRSATACLSDKRIGALPVMDGDKVIGIFSERDVIYGLARHGANLLDMPLRDVMTSEPVTVTPDTPIISALSLITRRRIRHLPVCIGDKLVGFVSIGDLVKSRIDAIEAEANAMRDYIQTA